MSTPLASIVIPTFNHGARLPAAIASARAQTAAEVEILVVDDGSTDDTAAILEAEAGGELLAIRLPHGGPSRARNAGLEAARGEYVQFLDADDLLAPDKIARQVAELRRAPEAGWAFCDVEILDEARGRRELASYRYDYHRKELSGWIAGLLEPANFIPIMAPIVRREVLEGIRFYDPPDGSPEDWRFWQRVAARARVRYVPEVLGTYHASRTGRNRLPAAARAAPGVTPPLRLNLGCGTPGSPSWHPLEGLVNLDRSIGWRFEDGLGEWADRTVAGITISHALMYLELEAWPALLGECTRVLEEDGVLRLTEDDTANPASARRGGWQGSEPARTLTWPAMAARYLERAGLYPVPVGPEDSRYRDRSLCQRFHGDPPDVFFLEGIKLRAVVFAPHNDDETLFAAFSILRYRPRIVVCYPSAGDYGDAGVREAETRAAMAILGAGLVEQWDGGDLVARMREYDARVRPLRVFAPDPECSHPEHVATARAAAAVFGDRLVTYHTYNAAGKVRRGTAVPYEAGWLELKRRALEQYRSQRAHPRARQFFAWDPLEYSEALWP